jgi:hypothetical protein
MSHHSFLFHRNLNKDPMTPILEPIADMLRSLLLCGLVDYKVF